LTADAGVSTPEVRVWPLYEWALPPVPRRVSAEAARRTAALYEEHFRWVRRPRVGELRGASRLWSQVGWSIPSPVDIPLTPVHDVDVLFDAGDSAAGEITNGGGLRDRPPLAVPRTDWLRVFQFRTQTGWESMFIPNRDGTIEWRLGWAVEIPRGYFLAVAAAEEAEERWSIPGGAMSSSSLERMSSSGGMAIAVRPTRTVRVRRGETVARMMLLHTDSLHAHFVADGVGEGSVDPLESA
jgi:hypothetical protein